MDPSTVHKDGSMLAGWRCVSVMITEWEQALQCSIRI